MTTQHEFCFFAVLSVERDQSENHTRHGRERGATHRTCKGKRRGAQGRYANTVALLTHILLC